MYFSSNNKQDRALYGQNRQIVSFMAPFMEFKLRSGWNLLKNLVALYFVKLFLALPLFVTFEGIVFQEVSGSFIPSSGNSKQTKAHSLSETQAAISLVVHSRNGFKS